VEILKVSESSHPEAIASTMAEYLKNNNKFELEATGKKAVDSAVKAIALTRGYVIANGIEFLSKPVYSENSSKDENKTIIKFLVESIN
jgi:stage V sporulation protein S